jgi:hypothetical protein
MEILNLRMRVEALERAMGIVSGTVADMQTPVPAAPAAEEDAPKGDDKKASKSE